MRQVFDALERYLSSFPQVLLEKGIKPILLENLLRYWVFELRAKLGIYIPMYGGWLRDIPLEELVTNMLSLLRQKLKKLALNPYGFQITSLTLLKERTWIA